MDKGKAYSILVTWADFADNPARANWCKNEMEKLLLRDLEETTAFISVQKDHVYLDLLSNLLPEIAYQTQSWAFIQAMEELEAYHKTPLWEENLAHARKKLKRPNPQAAAN